MTAVRHLAPLIVGCVVALAALFLYGREVIVPEDFALRADDYRTHEELDGARFTATSVEPMCTALERHAKGRRDLVLWLGNSQLHTINQFREGEHLAPYWLRQLALPKHDLVPLGFSLPNANLQEYLVIARYAMHVSRPKLIILQLVFDDLREDDLRSEFSAMLTPDVRKELQASTAGKGMLDRFGSASQSAKAGPSALEGFVQRHLEDELNERLTNVSVLWSSRPNLRAKLATDLYYLRNAAFGITSSSTRRLIPIRYGRNMQALQEILAAARNQSIPVLAYVAPLRPDLTAPYDASEYREWKIVLAELAAKFDATLLDLDNLVPGSDWGTYHANEVDFMHFMGSGHMLVAQALQPHVAKLLGAR